ncbi:transglutaminase-like cysteine peptidase [Pelagibius sp.]|uniref:transglutaminase-like cysteine peptidase n=1 Tax=Pelagibius sp. TaxID=1931238 RepID=UPI003B5019BA
MQSRRHLPARRRFLAISASAAALALLPQPSQAKLAILPEPLPPSTPIGSGAFTNAPGAWLRMIKRYPSLHPGKQSLAATASSRVREAELDHVNRLVNAQVQFRLDDRENWRPATTAGDCEDFAIRKLELLVKRFAWPRRSLTLATCRAETGQGHAVLLAHTSRGTYALDNRRADVMPWRALPYRWVAREEPGSPFALWRTIATEPA